MFSHIPQLNTHRALCPLPANRVSHPPPISRPPQPWVISVTFLIYRKVITSEVVCWLSAIFSSGSLSYVQTWPLRLVEWNCQTACLGLACRTTLFPSAHQLSESSYHHSLHLSCLWTTRPRVGLWTNQDSPTSMPWLVWFLHPTKPFPTV